MPCLARAAVLKPGLLPCLAWCGLSRMPLHPESELPDYQHDGFIASLALCHSPRGRMRLGGPSMTGDTSGAEDACSGAAATC